MVDSAGISVVVITLNEEKNIRECLDSLLAQDYPKNLYEIIIVDASTDKTPEIVREYEAKCKSENHAVMRDVEVESAESYGNLEWELERKNEKLKASQREQSARSIPRERIERGNHWVNRERDSQSNQSIMYNQLIRLIRSERGFSRQKNKGLDESRFEIAAYTDADCIIPSDWLKNIDLSFRDKNIAALGGNAYPPPESNRFGFLSACVGHPAGGSLSFEANLPPPDESGISFAPGCNSAYRKKALKEVGGFDASFQDGGEDIDVSRRLRKKGFKIAYNPELTVYHKPRPDLRAFFKWNINVGKTKYNLHQPSLVRILLEPGSLLWVLIGILILMRAAALSIPAFLGALMILWVVWLGLLLIGAKPYRRLWQKRKRLRVRWWEALFIVPFLTYVRQLGIFIGEAKKGLSR